MTCLVGWETGAKGIMKPWKLITNGDKIQMKCVGDNFLMFSFIGSPMALF
jgi:hypothetical protein